MSDPNDAWQSAPSGDNYGDRSPRRDDGGRSPPPPERRARSRSPAQRNGGGGGGGGGGGDNPVSNPGNNLHVSGLARSVDQRALEEMFNRHGKVVSAQLMLDPHTQESRGFGFVKLESVSEAEAAIEALNGTSIDGKTLTVAHARRGRARTPTPGRYQGVKVEIGGPRGYGGGGYGGGYDRPYQPRSYDSRYADRGPPRGYDDRRYDDRRYDDRPRYEDRGRYDDRRDDRRDYRDRYEERGPPPPPVAGDRDPYYRSEPRGAAPYDRREERPRYDDRPRY